MKKKAKAGHSITSKSSQPLPEHIHLNISMADNTDNRAIRLTVFGKGIEVEKMQKRLRCAARATDTELQLSWRHEYPQTLNIGAENSTAVTCNNKLVLDGLKPTEEIEILLTRLKK